jgi:hypothetical protein
MYTKYRRSSLIPGLHTECHPERSEGLWCWLTLAMICIRANTKVPRFARDDNPYRDTNPYLAMTIFIAMAVSRKLGSVFIGQ